MLQRAASNAYSWWWASQIRTKQSKWLDNDLQEMEEKVKTMIKLIDEDADTFAKKAELYFRRRPELISFVEEAFRAYKALADRCDRISGELHKANHTIATAFPDQVQLELEDDDYDGIPKAITSVDPSKLRKQTTAKHQFSLINKNKEESAGWKRTHHRRISSHISKDKAQEEIERLQKEILVLQTEKEFVKSSYENGLAKYWKIEKQITEIQEEVSSLQDAFSASAIIEDDEARALMAATAIKSCEHSLVNLHEQQKITREEARIESERIKDVKEKLKALKVECGQADNETSEVSDEDKQSSSTDAEEEIRGLKDERLELQTICQKVKEHFEMSTETSVVELAEKIDELVDKVIMLELTVASQTSQINTLRTETDELQKNLRGLEEDKMTLIDDSNMLTERLKQAEEELQRVQVLEKSVHDEKGIIETHLAEASDNFNDLSEKLQSPKYHEQVAEDGASSKETVVQNEVSKEAVPWEDANEQSDPSMSSQQHSQVDDLGDVSELQLLILNGKEGSDDNSSADYKSILFNYKDTKNRLSELEKKNQEQHLETMAQVKELKIANAMKDEEIRILRQILGSLQANQNAQENSGVERLQNAPSTVTDGETSHAEEETKPRALEEKFRAEIDNLLDENLDFWLRFSTSYHQIQRFQTTFMDLKVEMEKVDGTASQEGASVEVVAFTEEGKQGRAPLDKRLRELNTELQVWLEKNAMLKGELQCRFSSLCSIQDEISKAIESEDGEFTHYQAAKCQGEVLNMKLENNKVAKELQAGLDHVRGLQVEVGRALSKLREKSLQLTAARSHQQHGNLRHLSSKTRVPLRTFLFGRKQKKPSIFSCMSPAMQKQYSDIRRSHLPT